MVLSGLRLHLCEMNSAKSVKRDKWKETGQSGLGTEDEMALGSPQRDGTMGPWCNPPVFAVLGANSNAVLLDLVLLLAVYYSMTKFLWPFQLEHGWNFLAAWSAKLGCRLCGALVLQNGSVRNFHYVNFVRFRSSTKVQCTSGLSGASKRAAWERAGDICW